MAHKTLTFIFVINEDEEKVHTDCTAKINDVVVDEEQGAWPSYLHGIGKARLMAQQAIDKLRDFPDEQG